MLSPFRNSCFTLLLLASLSLYGSLSGFLVGHAGEAFAANEPATAPEASLGEFPTILALVPALSTAKPLTDKDTEVLDRKITEAIEVLKKDPRTDAQSFETWWQANHKNYLIRSKLSPFSDMTMADYMHCLYYTFAIEEADRKMREANGDPKAIDQAGDELIQKTDSPIFSKMWKGIGLGATGTLIATQVLASAKKSAIDTARSVGNELQQVFQYSVWSRLVNSYIAPITDPISNWLGTKGGLHLRGINALIKGVLQGSGRKSRAAAKAIKKGQKLHSSVVLYSFPGSDPEKLGKWLHQWTAMMSVQMSTIPDLMHPDIRGARDHFMNVMFESPMAFSVKKSTYDTAETVERTAMRSLIPLLKEQGLSAKEISDFENLDSKINDLRFEDPRSEQIATLTSSKEHLLADWAERGISQNLIDELVTHHSRILASQNNKVVLLVSRLLFDQLYPEHGRGLTTDSDLHEPVEFVREQSGMYRLIEEQGARAQKVLDSWGMKLDILKYYQARGYGPESYRASPQYAQMINESCLVGNTRDALEKLP